MDAGDVPSYDEFLKLQDEYRKGIPLTLEKVGRVFGIPFWLLLIEQLRPLYGINPAYFGETFQVRTPGMSVVSDSEVPIGTRTIRQENDSTNVSSSPRGEPDY